MTGPGARPPPVYESRKTIIGSTLPAARAERYEASVATTTTAIAVLTNTLGSVGFTSFNSDGVVIGAGGAWLLTGVIRRHPRARDREVTEVARHVRLIVKAAAERARL